MLRATDTVAGVSQRKLGGILMKAEERAKLSSLCERIMKEQDHVKFAELILELDVLLTSFHPAEETQVSSQ